VRLIILIKCIMAKLNRVRHVQSKWVTADSNAQPVREFRKLPRTQLGNVKVLLCGWMAGLSLDEF